MATLTKDFSRQYETGFDPAFNDIPIIAADTIFEGAAVNESVSTGTAKPLTGADANAFLGFADKQCNNEGGAAAAKKVHVRQQGAVKITVAAGGVLAGSIADLGMLVYATDDDTFTGLLTGAIAIGRIIQHIAGAVYVVYFQSHYIRGPLDTAAS